MRLIEILECIDECTHIGWPKLEWLYLNVAIGAHLKCSWLQLALVLSKKIVYNFYWVQNIFWWQKAIPRYMSWIIQWNRFDLQNLDRFCREYVNLGKTSLGKR